MRRKFQNLFVSVQKSHKAVSQDTIAKWIKIVMSKLDLDTSIFTPHCVRAASASAAFRAKVPLDTILNTVEGTTTNLPLRGIMGIRFWTLQIESIS